MSMKDQLNRRRAEHEELGERIRVLSQQIRDYLLKRLAEERQFDVKRALFQLKEWRDKFDVLQKEVLQMERRVKFEELLQEREELEGRIRELNEERGAEEKELEKLTSHVTKVKDLDTTLAECSVSMSRIDDQIAELRKEVEPEGPENA
jgi:chromosome segregation ATPase